MKRFLILFLSLVLLFSFAYLFDLYSQGDIEVVPGSSDIGGKFNPDISGEVVFDIDGPEEKVDTPIFEASEDSTSPASGEDSGILENNGRDYSSEDCGFSYESYGVCSGKCPSGTCISDGRSCYCRLG